MSEDGQTVIRNDQLFEISMLRAENDKTKLRLRALQETVEKQATQMAQLQLKLDLPEGLGRFFILFMMYFKRQVLFQGITMLNNCLQIQLRSFEQSSFW